MKFVFYIIAFLTLSLSIVPCGDRAQSFEIHNKSVLKNAEKHHSHSNTDSCAPFCHCSCCSSLSFIETPSFIYDLRQGLSKIKIYHLPSEVIDVDIPVWQPPQLI